MAGFDLGSRARWRWFVACMALAGGAAFGQGAVYRCPGNPVLYTDSLSAKEARDKGCRTLEGAPITVIQSAKPRPPSVAAPLLSNANASASVPTERISPQIQRARDSDRRAILESEMRRDEQALADMKREFNAGEPERRGDERNYQKYIDRVADMKASIARKESDVAALKRELAKLPP